MKLIDKTTQKKIVDRHFRFKDYFKTPFSIFVTLFYAAFSLYFIFQVPRNILDIDIFGKPLKFLWYFSFLVLTWTIAYFNLKNIYISKNNFLFVILLTFIFFGYELFLLLGFFNNTPEKISGFLILVWFIAGVLLINLLWKVVFVFINWKAQPLVSQKNIFIVIQNSIMISYLAIGIYFLRRFLINREHFDIQETPIVLAIMYLVLSLAVLIYFEIKLLNFFRKDILNKNHNLSSFQSLFSIVLVRVLPITIWFLSLEHIFNHFNSIFDYLYAISVFLMVLITLFFGIYFYRTKKANGIFLIVSTMSIFLCALTAFVLNYFSFANEYSLILVFLIAINFFILLNIIFKPKINLIYRLVFNSFITSTFFYLFISLLAKELNFTLVVLPFELKALIDIIWLSNGLLLLVTNIISLIVDFGKISINTSKLYRKEKRGLFVKIDPRLREKNA